MLFVVPDWAPAPSWSIKTPLPWTWNKTARADLQFIAKQKTAFNLWRGWGGGAIIGELSVIGQVAVVRVQHLVPCICRAGAGAGAGRKSINNEIPTLVTIITSSPSEFVPIHHTRYQRESRRDTVLAAREKIKNELLLIDNHSIQLSDYICLSHHWEHCPSNI